MGGERVHQFEMVAMITYVVIKPTIFSPVARKPALTWQAVCTQIVVRGLKSYHPSMKWIRLRSTQLWHIVHIVTAYILCPGLWPLTYFSRIGSRLGTGAVYWAIVSALHWRLY